MSCFAAETPPAASYPAVLASSQLLKGARVPLRKGSLLIQVSAPGVAPPPELGCSCGLRDVGPAGTKWLTVPLLRGPSPPTARPATPNLGTPG